MDLEIKQGSKRKFNIYQFNDFSIINNNFPKQNSPTDTDYKKCIFVRPNLFFIKGNNVGQIERISSNIELGRSVE